MGREPEKNRRNTLLVGIEFNMRVKLLAAGLLVLLAATFAWIYSMAVAFVEFVDERERNPTVD
jgi:hypothetical protein